jgi:hypothetical protein
MVENDDQVTVDKLEAVDMVCPLDLAAALSGCSASVIEALGRIGVITTQTDEGRPLFSFRDALRVERESQSRLARKREQAEAARRRARRRRYAPEG